MIHYIGDSHVSVFSGKDAVIPSWGEAPAGTWDMFPDFRTYRLGPFLAYNIGQNGHMSKEILFHVLKEAVPIKSKVLLVFGEMDCRIHLVKQKDIQKRSLVDLTEECVSRYFRTVLDVNWLGYEVMVFGGIPTAPKASEWDNEQWGHYGTHKDRNEAARLFDLRVRGECEKNGLFCLSILDLLVDKDGNTDGSYFMDGIHLSQKAMSLIRKRMPQEVLQS